MDILRGAAVGALIFGGGTLAKNKAEDAMTKASDSFREFDGLFRRHSRLSGVPALMLKAIAMNESSLGKHPSVARGIAAPWDVEGSKSEDGKSWGLMQVTVPTARDYDKNADAVKLNNPDYCVEIASKHLARLIRKFLKEEYVVKAYNQGEGNMQKEIDGKIKGNAGTYWERYQRNYRLANEGGI